MSIAQFIGKPLASGGTELRSRRTGRKYGIEPADRSYTLSPECLYEIYDDGHYIGYAIGRPLAITFVETHDLSISAG